MSAGFALALAILTAVGWLTYRNLTAQAEADRWTTHSYIVIQKLEGLVSGMKDVETGERGYVITGDDKFLEPYNRAIGKVPTDLADLKRLTRDNARQQQQLAMIESLVEQKLAITWNIIDLYRTHGFPATRAIIGGGRGKAVMDEIRRRVSEAQAEEEQLLRQRLETKEQSRNTTLQGLLAGGIIGFIILSSVFVFLERENAQRKRAEAELSRQRDRLEEEVADRTAVLSREIEERRQAEEKLRETAAELQEANADLADSRRAAINLLEDALAASRQAEQAAAGLRESAHRLRTLSDQIPGGAIYQHVQRPDGRVYYAYMSAGIESLFGMPAEEILADPTAFLRLIVEDDRPRVAAATEQSARDLTPFDCEFRQRTVAGEIKWVQCRSMPRRMEDGSTVWDGIEMDITGRKQAEEALRESEEKLSLALSAAGMGVWQLDLLGQERHFDGQVCRCLGIDPARFGGTAEEFYAAVHPDDRNGITASLDRTIRDGEPYEAEYRAVWPDGSIRHVAARGQLARDAAGQSLRVYGLLWDITGRKQAEEALRRYELLASHSRDIILFVDCNDGRLMEVNAAAVAAYGYTREELLELTIHDLRKERTQELTAAQMAEAASLGIRFETVHRRRDGSTFPAEVSSQGAMIGQVQTLISVVRDITQRKLAEEALQKAHAELAQQMEERVRELSEKEVLLKEVHHRVKNNLQVISSLAGMQAEGSQDETVREELRDVTYRIRSMALVHEKLYQSENLASVDFAEYAKSLMNYLWRAHGAATEAVRLAFDLEPVSLPVDVAVPCGLILNELAGNALKHAFRGRSEGNVTVSLRGAGEGRTSLSVSDDGVGLPAGFDWRKSSSLGLRLVQMLAGQLKGTVEVSSDGGTKFEITFEYQGKGKNLTPPDLPLN